MFSESQRKRLMTQRAVIIMRRAIFMEDEGHDSFVMACSTREEAEKWIDNQEGEYFPPSAYYIAESQK
jgi:hypothetical protein